MRIARMPLGSKQQTITNTHLLEGLKLVNERGRHFADLAVFSFLLLLVTR